MTERFDKVEVIIAVDGANSTVRALIGVCPPRKYYGTVSNVNLLQ